jgi:hypothetical protein
MYCRCGYGLAAGPHGAQPCLSQTTQVNCRKVNQRERAGGCSECMPGHLCMLVRGHLAISWIPQCDASMMHLHAAHAQHARCTS